MRHAVAIILADEALQSHNASPAEAIERDEYRRRLP